LDFVFFSFTPDNGRKNRLAGISVFDAVDGSHHRHLDVAWSKNSCSFLIVVFEQGSRPFPASNGHVT
jgi:hypothetical protein